VVLVVDTHSLIWFLEGSDRLSNAALAALSDERNRIIVPTIVLIEMQYLYSKNRISLRVEDVMEFSQGVDRLAFYPLDLSVVESVPLELNIHDGIICATALVEQLDSGDDVRVVTRDEEIRESAVVRTLW
jgi:PIN domain nuclease of toxin-antitoxin system